MAEKLTDKGLVIGLIPDEEPAEKPDEAKEIKADEPKKKSAKKADK